MLVADAQHDVRIHRDEAAVTIEGEAPVARLFRECFDGLIIEPEIEHGIHHARHRGTRARPHRHQHRIGLVAEGLARDAADLGQRLFYLAAQICRVLLVVRVIISADVGGDREARRDRKAEVCHFGKSGALAAEQVAHRGFAFGAAVAEAIDPLALGWRSGRFCLAPGGRPYRLFL